jgi:uncharacterized coiled-coil protein SlyX
MKTITDITYPALALFALTCIAFSPQATAVCQQGCDLSNDNTFLGDDALLNNTTGGINTAIGADALFNNTTGDVNTAIGVIALFSNTTGSRNTATGWQALYFNTIGNFNTANGGAALGSNTTGNDNTATGASALLSNTTGNDNTANGEGALFGNTTGNDNTANGVDALGSNTTGSGNIALGKGAGMSLTTGGNNIDIGNAGFAGQSSSIRIGTKGTHTKTAIAGISGVAVPAGVGVIIDSSGHLGTVVSSKRFKDNVQPMDKASEAILALKPVAFCYKHELDPNGIPQFGLVAEDVEKVDPDLVARDDQGKPYTVRYEAVNAMLLNEFLKEHRRVEEQTRVNREQEATIADLRMALKQQQKQIATLTSQMQRVSDQLRASGTKLQIVVGNQ